MIRKPVSIFGLLRKNSNGEINRENEWLVSAYAENGVPLKKIGLFGGTFNPIHIGHLRAAMEAGVTFDLDPVLMTPSAWPPHKDAEKVAPAVDRLEMTRLATAFTPRLAVSDVEFDREGPSYTVETIEHLQKKLGAETQLHLIIGLDAFREYDTWHRYNDLFRIIPIIVLLRPDMKATTLSKTRRLLEKHLTLTISDEYCFESYPPRFIHPRLQTVYLLEVTRLDISSSRIRRLIKEKVPIRFLVPERVDQYIQERGLYL